MNILLAITMCLQAESAEETFRRVEETLAKAKTLSIQYRVDVEIGGQKQSGTGSVFLKEGNRLKIVLTGGGQEASAASDGTTVRCLPPLPSKPDELEWKTPATLNQEVVVSLLRAGCYELHRVPSLMHFNDKNPKEALSVSDFRKGEDDAGLRTLTFTLKAGTGKVDVKLWIDPKTWTLKRRVMSVEMGPGKKGTLTENYDTFKVNGDIPDDAFALPAKK